MLIKFPDGSAKEFENGLTALEIAGRRSQKLRKDALAVAVNGEAKDLTAVIDRDCELRFLTFEDDAGKRTLRHTASHVLAEAVLKVRSKAKLAIGPAIDNGFYYDFDVEEPFSPKDLEEIEK
jgi:threonyl-tRNA synthetase